MFKFLNVIQQALKTPIQENLCLELVDLSSRHLIFLCHIFFFCSCFWATLTIQYVSLIWTPCLRLQSRQRFFHSRVTIFLNIDNGIGCQLTWFPLMAPWLWSLLFLPVVFSWYNLPGARISVILNLSCASSLEGFPIMSRPKEGSDMESSAGATLKKGVESGEILVMGQFLSYNDLFSMLFLMFQDDLIP